MRRPDIEKVVQALELCRYDPDPGQEPKFEHSCKQCPYYEDGLMMCAMMYSDAIALLNDHMWKPFKKREMTDEEKKMRPGWCYILDCELPDDDEEILVSNGRYVWTDMFINDCDEPYLGSGHELDGAAWMPMPEAYKEVKEDAGAGEGN